MVVVSFKNADVGEDWIKKIYMYHFSWLVVLVLFFFVVVVLLLFFFSFLFPINLPLFSLFSFLMILIFPILFV